MASLKRHRETTDTLQPTAKRHKPPNSSQSQLQSSFNQHSLPIDECKDEILSIINNPSNDIVIITGDTGSGKSTQLSQILYNSGSYNKIIITQPRRIGAVSLARRVSKEMHSQLGTTVGYSIRFQDNSSIHTNIKYVTDGILLRELTMNRNTNKIQYDVIILDEAHERSLQTDILFAILRDIVKESKLKNKKPPFKLLITSATLNVDKFSSFFMDCPVYHINGRCFDVETFHCTQQQSNYIQACIETALQIHVNELDTNNEGQLGHILCFLTGQNEIERACKLMGEAMDELIASSNGDDDGTAIADCVILRAYGNLSYELQQNIFAKVPKNCRKIIFATNIAETSLTVNGVSYVIDPGLVKQKRYNPVTRMDELIINNISKISAIQRKGRAGRTRKGQCYRLYTKQVSALLGDIHILLS